MLVTVEISTLNEDEGLERRPESTAGKRRVEKPDLGSEETSMQEDKASDQTSHSSMKRSKTILPWMTKRS